MVDVLINIGNWLKELWKTKGGVFVLGVLFGFIPTTLSSYVLYRDILYIEHKLKLNEKETLKWRERAFNSENACLEKMKIMLEFLKSLEEAYEKDKEETQIIIDTQTKQLKNYQKISKNLHTLNKNISSSL